MSSFLNLQFSSGTISTPFFISFLDVAQSLSLALGYIHNGKYTLLFFSYNSIDRQVLSIEVIVHFFEGSEELVSPINIVRLIVHNDIIIRGIIGIHNMHDELCCDDNSSTYSSHTNLQSYSYFTCTINSKHPSTVDLVAALILTMGIFLQNSIDYIISICCLVLVIDRNIHFFLRFDR